MNDVTQFGRNIRRLREEAGLTQSEFAPEPGVPRTYLGGVEGGRRNVSLKNILAIAGALDVPPAAFFEGFGERS